MSYEIIDDLIKELKKIVWIWSKKFIICWPVGEIVKMSQYANGVDEEGVLQIDVIVRGEVPDLSNGMELTLTPYYENYIQTGQGEGTRALILISLILSFHPLQQLQPTQQLKISCF